MNQKFEELYEKYFSRIYFFIFKLCNDSNLAEELTQETFYQAFTSFHRFKGESDIFTWLAAIAKHTYYKYLRKNKMDIDTVSYDLVANVLCTGVFENPEEGFQKKDTSEKLQKTIKNIPEKYRDVVILRVYAEMSFAQIGQSLKISENSAKVIFFRAKKMIMEEFENDYNM